MSVISQTQTSLGQLSFLTQSFYWHVYVLLLSGRYFLVVFPVWVPSSSLLVSRLVCFVFFFFLRLVFLYGPRKRVPELTLNSWQASCLSFSGARIVGVCSHVQRFVPLKCKPFQGLLICWAEFCRLYVMFRRHSPGKIRPRTAGLFCFIHLMCFFFEENLYFQNFIFLYKVGIHNSKVI